jgi:hypothetical protein
MIAHRVSLTFGCLTAASLFTWAGDPRPLAELTPRPVTFAAKVLPLQDVLNALEKQTGNAVADRRSQRDNPLVKTPANPSTFWRTLDSLGLGHSAYQPDGGVALVDGQRRPLKTHYDGLFRFAVKRISVSRDEETQAHQCHVTLDVAWEPRFQPLYLNLDHAEVQFGKQREKLDRQTARSVAGACATEIELHMKAPPRTAIHLDTLKGELRVIGAPKMLDFTFSKPATGNQAEQEGVKVRLTYVNQSTSRWTVEVLIENPPGAIVPLESYQSWLDNNRIWLAWTDPKTKAARNLESTGEQQMELTKGMKIRYEFEPREKTPLPQASAEVTLHYRTPNRVVAFSVPFEFAALPLP